jgi:hypothetical protein
LFPEEGEPPFGIGPRRTSLRLQKNQRWNSALCCKKPRFSAA